MGRRSTVARSWPRASAVAVLALSIASLLAACGSEDGRRTPPTGIERQEAVFARCLGLDPDAIELNPGGEVTVVGPINREMDDASVDRCLRAVGIGGG